MKRDIKKESLEALFSYQKLVSYYETDSMMVVHHSNYIRYMEEARVDWMRQRELIQMHAPMGDISFAVLSTRCEHLAPLRFGDALEIKVQVQQERSKVRFEYAIFGISLEGRDRTPSDEVEPQLVALGMSLHIPLNPEFKVMKLPIEIKNVLEKEIWTETWL